MENDSHCITEGYTGNAIGPDPFLHSQVRASKSISRALLVRNRFVLKVLWGPASLEAGKSENRHNLLNPEIVHVQLQLGIVHHGG